MNIKLLLLLLSLPMMSFAWDGDSYDYKLGRTISPRSANEEGFVTSYAYPRASNGGYKSYQASVDDFFKGLGKSVELNVPDPSDAMTSSIEAVPELFR